MKVSELKESDLKIRLISLYDEYHRDISKEISIEDKMHSISKILKLLMARRHTTTMETVESVFNCYLFETNYHMTYGRFVERFKQQSTAIIKSNSSIGTSASMSVEEEIIFSRSDENKRLVAESLKTGILNKKAMYSYPQLLELRPNDFKRHDPKRLFRANYK